MTYRVSCDWCGCGLRDGDFAELLVKIKRLRHKALDSLWAEEVRPTMHFCVPSNEGYDRMGLDPFKHPDDCYERARAAIEGTPTNTPDLGMEWRLIPIGAIIHNPPTAGQQPDPDLTQILQQLPAHCRNVLPRAGITTLAQIEEMTDDQLLAIKGMGPKVLTTLRAALRAKKTS